MLPLFTGFITTYLQEIKTLKNTTFFQFITFFKNNKRKKRKIISLQKHLIYNTRKIFFAVSIHNLFLVFQLYFVENYDQELCFLCVCFHELLLQEFQTQHNTIIVLFKNSVAIENYKSCNLNTLFLEPLLFGANSFDFEPENQKKNQADIEEA